jgi:hypothetical protein
MTATPLGQVFAVSGAQASVHLTVQASDGARTTVGRFVGIRTTTTLLIAVVTDLSAPVRDGVVASDVIGQIDLLGEIKGGTPPRFQRGVTEYPVIGDAVQPIGNTELHLIFNTEGSDSIEIGQLQQDPSVGAYVNLNEMLSKHFAIFGTTGVGKSSGVALLLRRVLEARGDMRIFLIDPHNEYGHCFADSAQVLNPRNLKLPFWLFNFEEIVDVFFRGRPGVEEEVAILSETIPQAKAMFASSRPHTERQLLRKNDTKSTGFTVDTPVPYRLTDLVALVDERMGKLENRQAWTKYHRLISRIETVRNDPRYTFMFDNANVGGDTMVDCVGQLFRLPAHGRPMTIMQLAGFPAEVVDSVVSVVCRMAFDFGLWSDGAAPLLFVCEEAHRYAPADRTIGFGPTRKAVSRIAKEGRKYGVFLGLITQRPAELDATIISQCSTLFAMRMANDRDQAIVRAAVSDAAASLLAFVPSLGTREVFAFGEGVALPTRLHFQTMPAHLLPRSEAFGGTTSEQTIDKEFITAVVERWRGAMMSQKLKPMEDETDDLEQIAAGEFSTVVPAPPGFDHDRAAAGIQSEPTSGLPSLADLDLGAPEPALVSPAAQPPARSPADTTHAMPNELLELRRRLKSRSGF